MADQLLRALMYGYYVPDMEYVCEVPPVIHQAWGTEAWLKWVKPYPLSVH